MRNASPKRKGVKPKMTLEVVNNIIDEMPRKRSGRTAYLKKRCDDAGVKPVAFYAARRRLLTGVR